MKNGNILDFYSATSDTDLDGNGIVAIYQKRWNVEPYHKSLKQNASLESV